MGDTFVLCMWARAKQNLADVLTSEILVVASQLTSLWPRDDGKLLESTLKGDLRFLLGRQVFLAVAGFLPQPNSGFF